MKAFIKELAKREGLKSEVKIGDLREAVSKLQDMLAEEAVENMICELEGKEKPTPVFGAEFLPTLVKKCNAILKKKKRKERFEHIGLDQHVDINPAPIVKPETKIKK